MTQMQDMIKQMRDMIKQMRDMMKQAAVLEAIWIQKVKVKINNFQTKEHIIFHLFNILYSIFLSV